MKERQTWIQDKLGFLRSHIRRKLFSKLSAFKSQAHGAIASATTAQDISRASTDTDSMEINKQSTDTTLTSHEPHHSFRALFIRPAGHGPVQTDEKHAVIIPLPKAGDNNTYSLLQLPGIGAGGIRGEGLSDI